MKTFYVGLSTEESFGTEDSRIYSHWAFIKPFGDFAPRKLSYAGWVVQEKISRSDQLSSINLSPFFTNLLAQALPKNARFAQTQLIYAHALYGYAIMEAS